MFPSFHKVKRFIAGIALTWALLLVIMHERLLKQHHDTEKSAAQILTGNMLRIQCGEEVSVLRDRICIKRFKWVIVNWIKNKCFGEYGVTSSNDIDCSVYQYLVFVERVCPIPENVVALFASVITSQKDIKHALPKTYNNVSFKTLISQLQHCGKVCQWISARVNSTAEKWLKISKRFGNPKDESFERDFGNIKDYKSHDYQNLSSMQRVRQRILLHMGLLTKEYGLNFGEAAFVGGPLGELVQWTDLMSALHVLGHEVILSWSPNTLREIVLPNRNQMQSCQPARTVDLIFTDLTGMEQLREVLGSLYHYRCLVRILDVYGTDPEYNHPYFNPDKDRASSWGGKGLNPAQFFTHFPHSPDNSFMGFVVEKHLDAAKLKSGNTALLYGKRTDIASGKGKHKYLDKISEYYEDIHATMWSKDDEDDANLPSYVINHKNLEQEKFLELLRKSSLYVGLGLPLEGPAALEALANGVIFLNPKFIPHQKVDEEKPTNRKLTSQNPYVERIGEPYVYTVDIRNLIEVEEALKRIDKTERPAPYVPYEFTYEGFLERIDAYIENQNLCSDLIGTKTGSTLIWKHIKTRWPPPSVLQLKISDFEESCTSACSRHKMVCERTLFPEINSLETFRTKAQACSNHLKLFPRKEYEEFRKVKKKYQQFSIPCHPPSFNVVTEECFTQTDELLFSCACSPPNGIKRLCPCRQYQYEQIALFPYLD